ncbi:MAG TPA: DUF4157 domain-containing protein, partial [Pyrinomonadaceae bacterium]
MAAKVSRRSVPTGARNLDFSGVRVHTDAKAAASARAVNALAYTVGSHVVFGEGKFAPSTAEGRHLLAHELTHVAQQGNQGEPVVRRWNFLQEIGGWFAGDDFSPDELKAYLAEIDKNNAIENHSDSDNKARAIVKQWIEDKGGFNLTPKLKILLIKEMQSGFTGDDDEQAILTLLLNSSYAELGEIFGAGGIDPKDLDSDFHGSEEDELHDFYDQRFEGGAQAALSGDRKLNPVGFQKASKTYSWADLQAVIKEHVSTIETILKGTPKYQRGWISQEMARDDAKDIYQWLQKAGVSKDAMKDLAEERVRQDTVLSDLKFKSSETSDPAI